MDSDASLHMMGVFSLTEKDKGTIRESSKMLDFQAANFVAVSVQESTSKLGAFPWVHLVEDALSVPLSLKSTPPIKHHQPHFVTQTSPRSRCGSHSTL